MQQRSGIETGTVIETSKGSAQVMINKSKSCHECAKAQAGICGKGGAGMVMEVKNPLRARKGDTVTIELAKSTHVKAYFLAFALPVISLFLFSYLGSYMSDSTGIKGLDVAAGFGGLILAIAFSLRSIHKLDKSSDFRISKVLQDSSHNTAGFGAEEADYLNAFKYHN